MFDRKVRDQLREVEHKLDILDLHLTIRDPGTVRSADVFEGLRKSVINANNHLRTHMVHLVELDRVAHATDDIEVLRAKLGEYLREVGVARYQGTDQPEAYVIAEGDPLQQLVVDHPAYIASTGELVAQGVAHYDGETGAVPDQAAGADSNGKDRETAEVKE